MSVRQASLDRHVDEGEAHARAGRYGEAEAHARDVLAVQPRNARAHHLLALAALGQDRREEALASARNAIRNDRVNASYHCTEARCLAAAGRSEEAITSLRRALRLRPGFPEARTLLARWLDEAGRSDESLALSGGSKGEATELATLQNELALALLDRGASAEAIAAFRRAVALDSDFLPAWRNLGKVLYVEYLRLQGEGGEAAGAAARAELVDCFGRILARDPGNVEIAHLRDCVSGARVERPPDRYVETFFDRFAARFDARVLGELAYSAPAEAARMLEGWVAGRNGLRVADLGCGTGLSGEAWRAAASRLVGVDLSANMLERARARGIYDELVRSEIGEFLERSERASFDLVVLLDVFIYVGDLRRIVAAAARALAPSGRMVFSIEEGSDGDFALLPSGRYAHSRAYAATVARSAGLQPVDARPFAIRTEAGRPVAAVLFAFEKG